MIAEIGALLIMRHVVEFRAAVAQQRWVVEALDRGLGGEYYEPPEDWPDDSP